MSVEADIASLKLIAEFHKTDQPDRLFHYTVHRLHSLVPHFKWVGLFINNNSHYTLTASAGDHISLPTHHDAIIQIQINETSDNPTARLTVITGKSYRENDTDYSSLRLLADEIKKRVISNV